MRAHDELICEFLGKGDQPTSLGHEILRSTDSEIFQQVVQLFDNPSRNIYALQALLQKAGTSPEEFSNAQQQLFSKIYQWKRENEYLKASKSLSGYVPNATELERSTRLPLEQSQVLTPGLELAFEDPCVSTRSEVLRKPSNDSDYCYSSTLSKSRMQAAKLSNHRNAFTPVTSSRCQVATSNCFNPFKLIRISEDHINKSSEIPHIPYEFLENEIRRQLQPETFVDQYDSLLSEAPEQFSQSIPQLYKNALTQQSQNLSLSTSWLQQGPCYYTENTPSVSSQKYMSETPVGAQELTEPFETTTDPCPKPPVNSPQQQQSSEYYTRTSKDHKLSPLDMLKQVSQKLTGQQNENNKAIIALEKTTVSFCSSLSSSSSESEETGCDVQLSSKENDVVPVEIQPCDTSTPQSNIAPLDGFKSSLVSPIFPYYPWDNSSENYALLPHNSNINFITNPSSSENKCTLKVSASLGKNTEFMNKDLPSKTTLRASIESMETRASLTGNGADEFELEKEQTQLLEQPSLFLLNKCLAYAATVELLQSSPQNEEQLLLESFRFLGLSNKEYYFYDQILRASEELLNYSAVLAAYLLNGHASTTECAQKMSFVYDCIHNATERCLLFSRQKFLNCIEDKASLKPNVLDLFSCEIKEKRLTITQIREAFARADLQLHYVSSSLKSDENILNLRHKIYESFSALFRSEKHNSIECIN